MSDEKKTKTPNRYQERQDARRQRYLDLAAANREKGNAAYSRAQGILSHIPAGQPILIGHHSERRHRGAIARVDRLLDVAFGETASKADYFESRAAAVGNAGISSDDPTALEQLQEKLNERTRDQEDMKKANAVIRRHLKKGPDAATKALIDELGMTEKKARYILEPDCFGGVGYAKYRLSNNSAEIRRLQKRIDDLKKRDSVEEVREEHEGFTYLTDKEDNRIHFIFPGKPDDETRALLKGNGFKWSPTRGAWVRQISNAGLYAASRVKAALTK